MTKIYVCETGSIFEGGSAFAATTNFTKAWKLIRDMRIDAEKDVRFRYSKSELRGKWFWVHGHSYFLIREFDD